MPPGEATFADLCGGDLPDHNTALMTGYLGGEPSVAEQMASHGSVLPADNGPANAVSWAC